MESNNLQLISESPIYVNRDIKMVIVINRDIKMGRGKIGAQVGHVCVLATLSLQKKNPELLDLWLDSGQKKVILEIKDVECAESALLHIYNNAKSKGMIAEYIRDAGLTQIEKNSLTAIAIGADYSKNFIGLTDHLKLLN